MSTCVERLPRGGVSLIFGFKIGTDFPRNARTRDNEKKETEIEESEGVASEMSRYDQRTDKKFVRSTEDGVLET